MSSGSVRTFRSHRTLPTSSTTQTDVSSTETSKPTKCAIAAAPSPMLEVRPTPIQSSYVKGCTFIAGRIRRSRRDTPSFDVHSLQSRHSVSGQGRSFGFAPILNSRPSPQAIIPSVSACAGFFLLAGTSDCRALPRPGRWSFPSSSRHGKPNVRGSPQPDGPAAATPLLLDPGLVAPQYV